MTKCLSIFLIFSFLFAPIYTLANEKQAKGLLEAAPQELPVYIFNNDSGDLLGILPVSDDFFLWVYAPNTKPHGTATTTYVSPYFNVTENNATTTEHIIANGTPIATIETVGGTPTIRYPYIDHLQSTSLVTDSSANIVEQVEYKAFGTIQLKTGSFKEQQKYTGHELDDYIPYTEYTYAKARYLNTDIGRFLSEDPAFLLVGDQNFQNKYNRTLEEFLKDPQGLNSYSYARNNPIVYVDEGGEFGALALAPFALLAPEILAGTAIVGAVGIIATGGYLLYKSNPWLEPNLVPDISGENGVPPPSNNNAPKWLKTAGKIVAGTTITTILYQTIKGISDEDVSSGRVYQNQSNSPNSRNNNGPYWTNTPNQNSGSIQVQSGSNRYQSILDQLSAILAQLQQLLLNN